jgi:hypothetical protein
LTKTWFLINLHAVQCANGITPDPVLETIEEAIAHYEQTLLIARESGDRRGEAFHSWNLGLEYQVTDPARAVELLSVCVAYEREIGHPDAQADAERVEQIRRRMAGHG